jgi:hypothetical protein
MLGSQATIAVSGQEEEAATLYRVKAVGSALVHVCERLQRLRSLSGTAYLPFEDCQNMHMLLVCSITYSMRSLTITVCFCFE